VSTEREVGELRRQLADAQAQLAEAQAERDEAFSKGFEQVRRRCVAAEARAEQAEATIAAVQSLADEWERKAGPESRAWSVFGQQVVSVPFAVEQIRAALAAAGPSAPETPSDPTNACRECGIDNPVWFAPNEVWNAVMGDHTGFLCPRCFIVRAEASGLRPTAWILTPEEI